MAGKKTWDANAEMKRRREEAQAKGKGNWDANAELKKRRQTAQSKKKAQGQTTGWNSSDYMADRVATRLADHESGKNPFKDEKTYDKVKKMYERKLGRG